MQKQKTVKIQPVVLQEEHLTGEIVDKDENNELHHIKQENHHQTSSSNIPSKQETTTSFNSVMFALMASAMGTGIFNLPFRVTQTGLLAFIVYVLASAAFSINGALILNKLVKQKGYSSYGEMSEAAFGRPLKALSQFCLIIFPWGIAVCFQVILSKFVIQLLVDLKGWNLYQDRINQIYNQNGNMVRIMLNIGVILSGFSLIALKEINIIQKLSVLGVLAVIFNTCIIVYAFLFGFYSNSSNIQYPGILNNQFSNVELLSYKSVLSISPHVQALASILFCYVNHQLVFPACKSLADSHQSRLRTLFVRANLGQMSIYLLIGISGYLLLIQNVDIQMIGPMVITSIPIWQITVGKIMMVVSLYLAIPLNLFPARTILLQAMNMNKSNSSHYLSNAFLAGSSCTIAIIFEEVNGYFGLLGGTAGVLMAGGIPSLCFYKLSQRVSIKQQIMLLFCGLMTLGGMSGAILSVIG